MAKKEKLTPVPITIDDLSKDRWIRTPILYAQQGATLNLMQQDVLLMVSKQLQGYIDRFFGEGRNHSDAKPNSAIPDDVLFQPEGMPSVRLKMSEITEKYNYGRLVDALKDMRALELRVEVLDKMMGRDGKDKTDENGTPVLRPVYKMMPLFDVITVPKNIQNLGYIELHINTWVARTVFDMNHGFVEHLARIAKYSNVDATPKVYMFLKAKMFVYHKNILKVSLADLKRATGHLVVDPKTGEVKSEKYPKWSHYALYVLAKAQGDLDRMSLVNETEFTFRYFPIYANGRSRGNPDYVQFSLYVTQLGVAHKRSKGKPQRIVEQDLFAEHPESRREQERRDWQRLMASYDGVFKPYFERATFLGTHRQQGQRPSFYLQFASEDDYNAVRNTPQKDFDALTTLIVRMFGSTYSTSLWGTFRRDTNRQKDDKAGQ